MIICMFFSVWLCMLCYEANAIFQDAYICVCVCVVLRLAL